MPPVHCAPHHSPAPTTNTTTQQQTKTHKKPGVYPFAGREVARAFAMLSTELADCSDDLSGLAQLELDNLREWEEKFNWKVRRLCVCVEGSVRGGQCGRGSRRVWPRLNHHTHHSQPQHNPFFPPQHTRTHPTPPPPRTTHTHTHTHTQYPAIGRLTGKALAETVGQRTGAIPTPEPARGPTFRSEANRAVAEARAAGQDARAALGR